MKLVYFELKKLWRQKKIIWLIVLILFVVGSIFANNYAEREGMVDRAYEKVDPFQLVIGPHETVLRELERDGALSEVQQIQLESINEMGSAIFNWRNAIYHEEWDAIPIHEGDFLIGLQKFVQHGGEFSNLKGMKIEEALAKNTWLQEHDLPYEDEVFPISPHLIVIENMNLLFSIVGLGILLFLFGNSLTIEKEHNTWLTLKTQPIPKWKLILAKYASLLITGLIFIMFVIGLSILLPMIVGDSTIRLDYPQIVASGDSFTVISTISYVGRVIGLFVCASFFAFGLILFISKWVKNTFSSFMLTGFIIILGYFITGLTPSLQVVWNPFQLLHFQEVLSSVGQGSDWLYAVVAILWSTVFLLGIIFLPEKEYQLFQSADVKKPFHNGKTSNGHRAIRNMFVFEWRKMNRKGLVWQGLTLLSLLIVFGYILISNVADEKESDYQNRLMNQAVAAHEPMYEEMIADFKEEMERAEEAGDDTVVENYQWLIEDAEAALAFLRERQAQARAALDGLNKGDWTALYEYQLVENRFANNELHTGNYSSGIREYIGQFTINASLAEKEWLMKYNIQPVFAGEYVTTIHHQFGDLKDDENTWNKANQRVDDSGLFSLYFLFENYLYLIPLVLFVFLLGGGFAMERGKKATINLLRTQPISLKNIYLGKVLHSSIVALLSWVGIFLFVVVLGTVFNRFGDWYYPILRYDPVSIVESENYTGIKHLTLGGHFIPIGEYLVHSVVLFFLVTLFIIILMNFLSLFIKNLMGVFITVLLICAGGYAMSSQVLPEALLHLLPFTYFNIAKITNGEAATIANNPSIDIWTGSSVLLVGIWMIIIVGYLVLRWRKRVR